MFIPSHCVLVGNLGADPESIVTRSGTTMVKVRVAVSQGKDEPAAWCDVVAFAETADGVIETLRKGDGVIIAARLREESWTAKDGSERKRLSFIADEIGKRCRARNGGGSRQQGGGAVGSDDIPF